MTSKSESILNPKILTILSLRLAEHQWAIRGTASLKLQEVNMNVDDIDIICNKETALACNELFKEFLIEEIAYKESDKFKSYFGSFLIESVQVEVMGEWQIRKKDGTWCNPFAANKDEITTIIFQNLELPVTSISTETSMFVLMQRWNALKIIKAHQEGIKQPRLFA